jgi:hypothetical protein
LAEAIISRLDYPREFRPNVNPSAACDATLHAGQSVNRAGGRAGAYNDDLFGNRAARDRLDADRRSMGRETRNTPNSGEVSGIDQRRIDHAVDDGDDHTFPSRNAYL